ncbi:colanic acid/amylovoran biosynthesis protein [Virgibacillus subterraneus]|uniref:Colanic acid/amylovoran biosynthesis protein n=1 Tax=Virgibacillus subterraneus TaxID=621109 RepID=A0A1H8ZT94_9BACI|nr:polysaccharide pyruvyl transferase family protein [Virgibacillus subterraneus]SEP67487.1 colanic acid/amylovoran biosynthesis protein [Virgibacillus subterraneus]
MSKKRVLVNAYFAQNLGDDLFLKVLFDRYPNVEFHLLTASENYNIVFQNYRKVKIIKSLSMKIGNRTVNLFNKLHEGIVKYRNYNAFLNIGGSIFMESMGWQKSLESRSQLPEKFKEGNKKTYIIGANFGPFEDDLFIEKHKEFFSHFDDICFRDNYSYKIFGDLNNVRSAPDVVFSLKGGYSVAQDKFIGFSIIDVEKRKDLKQYFYRYIQKMSEIAITYIDLGYKIKFFSFCENEGDLRAINYILNSLDSCYTEQVKVVNYSVDINTFLDEYKACETVIGTRFHSIILSLLFNQNIFPIIYSDKSYNVLKDINMDGKCCFIKDIEELDVKKMIKILPGNKLKNRSVMLEAEKQFNKLDLLLL